MISELIFSENPANIHNYHETRIKDSDLFKEYDEFKKDEIYNPILEFLVTSVGVERLFSLLNNVNRKNRNFKNESILMYLSSLNVDKK